MIEYPQETTALRDYNLDKIYKSLQQTYNLQGGIGKDIQKSEIGDDIYLLYPSNTNVDLFTLPLKFEGIHNATNSKNIIVDVRPFTRMDKQGLPVITNRAEWYFNIDIAALTVKWLDGGFNVPHNLLMRCWVNWIGSAIISKLNIEYDKQPIVNIITAYYLYCLLTDLSGIPEDRNLRKIASTIAKATFTSTLLATEIVMSVGHGINGITKYIEALQKVTQSERFDKLTPGFLFSLVSYSWYGNSAPRITAAALEYPPIFIAMVYNAIVRDAYNKTGIGRDVKTANNADKDEFEKRIKKLIEG